MWKKRNITKPPDNSLLVKLTDGKRVMLSRAQKTVKKSNSFLESRVKLLSVEQYILHRIIYKLSNQFRSEKSMRGLKRMKSCLIRLDEVNVTSLLSKLFVDLFDGYDTTDDGQVFMMSCQALEYYLVRVMGTAGLLCQTANYSRETHLHAKQNTGLGNMIPQHVIIMSLAARIWLLCTSLCAHLCNCYRDLVPCLGVLRPTSVGWLPELDKLPEDLDQWLKIEFSDSQNEMNDNVVSQELASLDNVHVLRDIDELSLANLYDLDHVDDVGLLRKTMRKETTEELVGLGEDIGEPVQRKCKEDRKPGKLVKRKMKDETRTSSGNGSVSKKNISSDNNVSAMDISGVFIDIGKPVKRKQNKRKKLGTSVNMVEAQNKKYHGDGASNSEMHVAVDESSFAKSCSNKAKKKGIEGVTTEINQQTCQLTESGKPVKLTQKQVRKYLRKNMKTLCNLKQFKEELLLKQRHDCESKLGVSLTKKQKRKLARKIEVTIEKQKSKKSTESEKSMMMNIRKTVGRIMHKLVTGAHQQ